MKPIFGSPKTEHWNALSQHLDLVYLEQFVSCLDWNTLSKNPNAIPLIEQHLEKVNDLNGFSLSENPNVVSMLLKPHLFRIFEDKIQWGVLCDHPKVSPLLESHMDKIKWPYLSRNPEVVPFLEKHLDKIDWYYLSENPSAIHLLEKYPEKISSPKLGQNPNGIQLLVSRLDEIYAEWDPANSWDWGPNKIHWDWVCGNSSALPLLEKYPENIVWEIASSNPQLLPLFEQYPENVVWDNVCASHTNLDILQFLEKHIEKLDESCWQLLSSNPHAIPLVEKYPEHIDWWRLSRNPAAIPLLEKNPEKINWKQLSANPSAAHLLFPLDLVRMKKANEPFQEELVAYVFHPDRLCQLCKSMGIDFQTYIQDM